MRILIAALLILCVCPSAGALTEQEKEARWACLRNVDFAHSGGPDSGKWKFARGYEMCRRLYPAIESKEFREQEEAEHEIRDQDQKELRAVARDLGIKP
jgi:hypothetical protein